MNYTRFEGLVIGAGAVTIAGSVLVSIAGNGWPGWPSLLSQLLLLPVLIFAVHYGRRAGLIAALLASAVFIVLKIPVLSASEGLAGGDLAMIAFSIAAFGLVGIVGGDLCGRVKYFFGRYDASSSVDDWSGVYNQRKAGELLGDARERCSRYAEPFSIVIIAHTPQTPSELNPKRQRALVRAVANHLRGDVRMVDEVARLDDGRFLVILPHTVREGGLMVAKRLSEGVRETLDADEGAVAARCFSSGADDLEIGSLTTTLGFPAMDYAGSTA